MKTTDVYIRDLLGAIPHVFCVHMEQCSNLWHQNGTQAGEELRFRRVISDLNVSNGSHPGPTVVIKSHRFFIQQIIYSSDAKISEN